MRQKTTDALSRFRALISSEQLPAGEFLPPERELCERLKIGRGALRVICAKLEAEKLLVRIPCKGIKILSSLERNNHRRLLMILPSKGLNRGAKEIMTVLLGAAVAGKEENAELVLYAIDATLPDPDSDSMLITRLMETPWNGVIFLEDIPPATLAAVQAARLNYCIANYEDDRQDLPAVCVDFREVGRMAGRFFIKKGHRRIGYLGGDAFFYREQLAGLRGTLAEEYLAPDPDLVFLFNEHPRGKQKAAFRKALLKALDNRPCAMFCGRDHWAGLLFDICRDLNLRVPQDVAILGYDGLSWDDATQNGLSSIQQPAYELGAAVVHALCRGRAEQLKVMLISPSKLVERTSTGLQ